MKNLIEKLKEFFNNLFGKAKGLFTKKKDGVDLSSVEAGNGAVSSDTVKKENLTEADQQAEQAAHEAIMLANKKKKALIKRIAIIIIAIVVIMIVWNIISKNNEKNEEIMENMRNSTTVKKMNIASEISGSGTLKPKENYTIISLVEGNITNVYFDVGDIVVKDQLLLTIESSTAYRNIINASSSVTQAQDSYNQAKYEYEKVEEDYANRTYKAPHSGSLREFKVKVGDKINTGTEIGTIVNDKRMKLKVPFVSVDMAGIKVGTTALLELQETGEVITGKVTGIAQESQVLASGALVKYVTIECENPGGLTKDNTALAYIGNVVSFEDAAFEEMTNEVIKFEDGNDVEIEKLLVSEGAYVSKGTPLFLITNETITNVINNKKRVFHQAEEALTRAENEYDDAVDTYDEYFITAPIDGSVISKDARVGDKIQRNTNNAKTLATLYDLSELTFDMDVDELDISNVKEGLNVIVYADAFNNEAFEGVITNVSLIANNSNGVTSYPVTVTLYDASKLLPGMNVDAYVVLESASDVLGIPSDALQRGDVVYVKDDSPSIKNKTAKFDNIADRVKNKAPEGFTAVNVVTGVSNENFIEIKEGLTENDIVYVETNSQGGFGYGNYRGGPGGMRGGMRR